MLFEGFSYTEEKHGLGRRIESEVTNPIYHSVVNVTDVSSLLIQDMEVDTADLPPGVRSVVKSLAFLDASLQIE